MQEAGVPEEEKALERLVQLTLLERQVGAVGYRAVAGVLLPHAAGTRHAGTGGDAAPGLFGGEGGGLLLPHWTKPSTTETMVTVRKPGSTTTPPAAGAGE